MENNEKLKEVGLTTIKALIQTIPVIGSALNEIVFEHRSRIKQNRVSSFIKILSEFLEKNQDLEIDIEKLNSEEFSDVLESTLKRVCNAGSERKLKRFRNIIINQLKTKNINDFSETFLDLTSNLNEKQIEILFEHSSIREGIGGYYEQIPHIEDEIEALKTVLKKERKIKSKGYANDYDKIFNSIKRKTQILKSKKISIEETKTIRDFSHYNLNEKQYSLLIQDLVSKSLLIDIGRNTLGIKPFTILEVTDLGREYLNFIQHIESKNENYV